MFDAILLKLVELIIKYSFKTLERNYKILKLLDNRNLLNLQEKPEFDFVYARTLIEYGMDKTPIELLYLFALKDVKEAFNNELYNKQTGAFLREIDSQLHTNKDKKLQPLKNIFQAKNLPSEIDEFKQNFEYITNQTATPFQLRKYNEDKQFQYKMLEKNYKSSFEYQSEEYLKHLINEFNKEFPKNKYIQQKGEIRQSRKSINKSLERTMKYIRLDEELKNEYVRTQFLIPIDKYINNWINDDSQNFLAIMGEYGTGKSTLCKHIAKELALSYSDKKTKIINDKHKRIVILLNLRSFKEEEVEKFINAELTEYGIKDFDTTALYKRIDNKELIFIFDGFDEMTLKIETDEKTRNFNQIQKLIEKSKNSKIILTSREEYFTSDTKLNKIFSIVEKENYKMIYLNLFDKEQIKAYLTAHTDDPGYYLKEFNRIYDLNDLAKRPVLLNFVIKYLPELIKKKGRNIKINASELYKIGINRELERLKDKIPDIDKKISKKKRLELLQKLSLYLYEYDTFVIDTKLMKKILDLQKFFKVDEEDESKYLNDFLNFTFLSKEGNDLYRISHKSFRDYLVATELVQEINKDKINIFAKHQTSKEINHFISELKPDRKILESMVKEKKEITEQNKWQKSNAINLILKMDNSRYDGSVDFNKNEIVLDNSNLLNISILEELTNITSLVLWNNQIRDIEPLKELEQLTYLHLKSNQIDDIEPLKGLTNLKYLNVQNNQISDIRPLMKLKYLTDIDFKNNDIDNIEVLKYLTNLSLLNLTENRIINIESLKFLDILESLDLDDNQISNVDALKELQNLTILYLKNNQIRDIEPLKELENLKELYLSGNPLKESQIEELEEALPDTYVIFDVDPQEP